MLPLSPVAKQIVALGQSMPQVESARSTADRVQVVPPFVVYWKWPVLFSWTQSLAVGQEVVPMITAFSAEVCDDQAALAGVAWAPNASSKRPIAAASIRTRAPSNVRPKGAVATRERRDRRGN